MCNCKRSNATKWALVPLLFMYVLYFLNGWYVAQWMNDARPLVIADTSLIN
jgi:hypothetical protein